MLFPLLVPVVTVIAATPDRPVVRGRAVLHDLAETNPRVIRFHR
ncbi:hypothetical protein TOK_5388 [Pseudonocardia sp. N23]|nr:hypothetical protein TOK_5388 [Pseudonocardia sp. N23]